jgi:C1A family cysteine protease
MAGRMKAKDMTRTIAKSALLMIFLGAMASGFAGQTPAPSDDVRLYPKGLIPLTGEEAAEILRTWPQVARVEVNWLGFERINKVRAEKGERALDPSSVRPVGHEVESVVGTPAASLQSYAEASALALDLPVAVDNSKLKYFPPIRSQNPLGSCASFSTTYTQLSYMTAFQRDLDIRNPSDNTNKYSPKWTYNMINGGTDSGSSFNQVYPLLEKHGAATWAEFPYDTNYTAWCLNAAAWRNALSVRSNRAQFVNISAAGGLEYIKELLADGYVLIFGTFVTSWQYKTIGDDPSTTDDTPEIGKRVGYWLNGEEGSHAMTIVGYNDAIWTDINGNGIVDAGEKGGFRIANSWGTAWEDAGFIWLAYDALKSVSGVVGGPSAGREPAFQGNLVWVLTARDNYSPLMIAEFTVNHAKRNQLKMTLGRSASTGTTPTTTWTPAALQNQGGNMAFDGTTTAVDGTFVLDYSDILAEGAGPQRYYLGVSDNFTGDVATLKAFKLVDLTTSPATETVCAAVPLTVDAAQGYGYVDYTYLGPSYDHPPTLSSPQVAPAVGTTADAFSYSVFYADQDGDTPSIKEVVIDGTPHAMTLVSGSASNGWYGYDAALAVGSHDYYFSFRDSRGATARAPLAGASDGPNVYAFLLTTLSPSNATAGGSAFTLTVNGSSFVDGAVAVWDATNLTTTFVNSARVSAAVPASLIATGKTVQVTVRNPDSGVSNPLTFTVSNPIPSLTSLSPDHASGGGGAFTLTVTGTNFVSGAAVLWNGVAKTTTYVGPTQLTAAIAASDIAASGTIGVIAQNPTPGGGTSAAIDFPVAGFTVTGDPTTNSVSAGQSTTYTVHVAAQTASFDSAVTLSCPTLPRGVTATFSPASVTPGIVEATSQLTLATKASSSAAAGVTSAAAGGSGPFGLGALLLTAATLLLAPYAVRRHWLRAPLRRWLIAGAAISFLIMIAACSAGGGGGGNNNSGTPTGTYQVGIRGASGSLMVSTTVELVVR